MEADQEGTEEEPVLLHPNMASDYRQQVAEHSEALNAEEHRTEAADLIRSLVNRIELTPNEENRLDIDLYGDLAGMLTLAANKNAPLDESDASVQQVKVVEWAGFEPAKAKLVNVRLYV